MNADAVTAFATALAGQGPFAVVCAIMFWRDIKRDEREDARELRREDMERDRIKADNAMAVSLALIAERVAK